MLKSGGPGTQSSVIMYYLYDLDQLSQLKRKQNIFLMMENFKYIQSRHSIMSFHLPSIQFEQLSIQGQSCFIYILLISPPSNHFEGDPWHRLIQSLLTSLKSCFLI